MVMFELTSGVDYYLPVQKKANFILTANLGLYNERMMFPKNNTAEEYINHVEENWNSRFGFNGGLGFESDFYNNLKWNVLAKYHYIFNEERDMKFLNINIGLKYYF